VLFVRPQTSRLIFFSNLQVLLERQTETMITNISYSRTRILSSDTMAIRFVYHELISPHLAISIAYHPCFCSMQIIHVNLTQESPKLIDVNKALDMTYSVKWEPTNITFAHRFDVYLDYPFFEHQVI
jgi:hypothetical protein